MTSRHRRRRPVAILVHSYYEEDPRVRREAEALVAAGHEVDVYALRRDGDGPGDVIDGVCLRRLDVQRHQGAGVRRYLAEYLSFFARAGVAVTLAHRRRRYALVQVATLPDFLVFAGLPLKLVAGVRLILDLHEAMPEFFRMRFAGVANPLGMAALRFQERLAIAAADAVITVNDALGERLIRLGTPPEKVTVVLNSPSLRRFDPSRLPGRPFCDDGTLRLVYAGALTPTYELDVVLDAVAALRRRRPELPVALDLYGRGDAAGPLRAQAERLSIGDLVTFHGRVPIEDVPEAIARADIGLAPTRRNPFTDFSLSTKVFEYAAMGKPVVATRLRTVERYFAPDTLATYTAGDADDLASTILRLVDDEGGRVSRVAKTAARVGELAWDVEAARYVALVERLIA